MLDDVAPFDPATVRAMVTRELGRSPGQLFKAFDDRPLASASIAQVHAVELPDGRHGGRGGIPPQTTAFC
ncbi:MAG: hypothetical protein KDB09_15150 [Acidimicrobiales bacterium]|nr:hypothetical protein [Acidimicrobiales bacterium]